jgi:hypothetical protein
VWGYCQSLILWWGSEFEVDNSPPHITHMGDTKNFRKFSSYISNFRIQKKIISPHSKNPSSFLSSEGRISPTKFDSWAFIIFLIKKVIYLFVTK